MSRPTYNAKTAKAHGTLIMLLIAFVVAATVWVVSRALSK